MARHAAPRRALLAPACAVHERLRRRELCAPLLHAACCPAGGVTRRESRRSEDARVKKGRRRRRAGGAGPRCARWAELPSELAVKGASLHACRTCLPSPKRPFPAKTALARSPPVRPPRRSASSRAARSKNLFVCPEAHYHLCRPPWLRRTARRRTGVMALTLRQAKGLQAALLACSFVCAMLQLGGIAAAQASRPNAQCSDPLGSSQPARRRPVPGAHQSRRQRIASNQFVPHLDGRLRAGYVP